MIDLITDIQQLTPLKARWDALAQLQRNLLLSFDWFASCAETIHAADGLRVVVVRRQETVVAIAPLCLINRDGVPRLELLGASVLFEPSGFLYADQQSLMQLLLEIARLGFPLVLLRLPDDPLLLSCVTALAWRNAITLRRLSAPSAFLSLPSNWDLFLESLSSKRRYDFRRKRRCLEKSGKVRTRILKPGLSDLPTLLQEALLVEDSSWKGRQGSSLLKNPGLRSFFECYMRRTCENGSLRICFIDIDNTPVSMHIAIESDSAFWVLKLGYDESLARCSPGTQLAMDTIEFSVRQGLSRYEFLGSEEPWQHAWPIKTHACFTVLIYPYSLHGLRGLFEFAIRYAKKQLHWITKGLVY